VLITFEAGRSGRINKSVALMCWQRIRSLSQRSNFTHTDPTTMANNIVILLHSDCAIQELKSQITELERAVDEISASTPGKVL
jgi:hypothetical protein